MQIVKVEKSVETGTYILRGTKGELCVIDADIFPTVEDLHANIESGKVGRVAEGTINMVANLYGPEAIDGLAAEVEALTDLETVYEA